VGIGRCFLTGDFDLYSRSSFSLKNRFDKIIFFSVAKKSLDGADDRGRDGLIDLARVVSGMVVPVENPAKMSSLRSV
jgi:hypothetical protein